VSDGLHDDIEDVLITSERIQTRLAEIAGRPLANSPRKLRSLSVRVLTKLSSSAATSDASASASLRAAFASVRSATRRPARKSNRTAPSEMEKMPSPRRNEGR
jgi:hypothetical protein